MRLADRKRSTTTPAGTSTEVEILADMSATKSVVERKQDTSDKVSEAQSELFLDQLRLDVTGTIIVMGLDKEWELSVISVKATSLLLNYDDSPPFLLSLDQVGASRPQERLLITLKQKQPWAVGLLENLTSCMFWLVGNRKNAVHNFLSNVLYSTKEGSNFPSCGKRYFIRMRIDLRQNG
ncbi:hypothetical protein Tco_0356666 [Tanacetum coccineum]